MVDTPSSQSSSQQNTSRWNHISLKRTLFWDSMDEVCPEPNDPHGPRKLTKSTPNEHKNQGNQGFLHTSTRSSRVLVRPNYSKLLLLPVCVLRMCAVDLPNPPPHPPKQMILFADCSACRNPTRDSRAWCGGAACPALNRWALRLFICVGPPTLIGPNLEWLALISLTVWLH